MGSSTDGPPVAAPYLGEAGAAVPCRIGMARPWVGVWTAHFPAHADWQGDAEPVVMEAVAAHLEDPAAALGVEEPARLLASAVAGAAQPGLRAAEELPRWDGQDLGGAGEQEAGLGFAGVVADGTAVVVERRPEAPLQICLSIWQGSRGLSISSRAHQSQCRPRGYREGLHPKMLTSQRDMDGILGPGGRRVARAAPPCSQSALRTLAALLAGTREEPR